MARRHQNHSPSLLFLSRPRRLAAISNKVPKIINHAWISSRPMLAQGQYGGAIMSDEVAASSGRPPTGRVRRCFDFERAVKRLAIRRQLPPQNRRNRNASLIKPMSSCQHFARQTMRVAAPAISLVMRHVDDRRFSRAASNIVTQSRVRLSRDKPLFKATSRIISSAHIIGISALEANRQQELMT